MTEENSRMRSIDKLLSCAVVMSGNSVIQLYLREQSCYYNIMKSLLKDKIVDLDLKLPQLSFLMDKRLKQKSFTERKSKETDVVASGNGIASAMKKRYDIPQTDSRKERSFTKHAKKNQESPKKIVRKVIVVSSKNPSPAEQIKNHLKFEERKEKLIVFKNSQLQKKKQRINLGDLLQYNQSKYESLPNIKIPKQSKKTLTNELQLKEKTIERQMVPCKYESIELIGQLDFLRLFILEQLVYILSQSNNYHREEMIGFCRIYLENSDKDAYFMIANVFKRRSVVEEALVLQKLAVYVILLLCTEEALSRESENLVKSISTFIHKNNLILLDLLMLIGEYENIEITSQFHIFNTMRFNESRRKISYEHDGIELIKQNNNSIKSLLEVITRASKFESLNGFVKEVVEGELAFAEQIDQVLFVLFSFQQVLLQSQQEDLPRPQAPFLPPTQKQYTLVLDLDETLIHTKQINGAPHFLIRPYCHDFLRILSGFYEIVIFTASVKQYADTILDTIDKQGHISHRLYRQHTRLEEYVSIKDISMLGRDLSKTIIIDNIPSNFKLQPRNGIYIATWTGNEEDCCLLNLIPVLELIVRRSSKDVRDSLETISKHMEQMLKQDRLVDLDSLQID